jgi:single-strand DNA-binding protein
MNFISIAGRIGKDPEQRQLQDGTSVLSFSVADDQGKDKQAIWWRCSLFGKRADSLAPYLAKGSSVTVVGTVTEREYVDKEGQQRKVMEVRVQDIALQGGKPEAKQEAKPQPKPKPKPSAGFEDFDDGDSIPF